MKTAGLLLIVAAGLLLGLMAAGESRRRVSTLGQLSRFMVRLADQIRYTAAPVEELLTAAESSGEFDGLSMLGHVCSRLRKGERVLAAWEGAVEEDGRDAGLTKADRELAPAASAASLAEPTSRDRSPIAGNMGIFSNRG